MTDIFNPTSSDLPTESNLQGRNFRYIPPPPSRELRDAQMQGEQMGAVRESQGVEQRTLDEFNPDNPIPYMGSNWQMINSGPNLPEMPNDIDEANALMEQVRQSTAARGSNTSLIGNIGSVLSNLENVHGEGFNSSMVGEHDPGQSDFAASVQNAWASRAMQTHNLTIAPGIASPLAGVTRAYHDGLPFNNAANHSARQWLIENAGVDIAGIETEREAVRPPSFVDRLLSTGARAARNVGLSTLAGPLSAISNFVPGVRNTLDNLTPGARPEQPAAARRILQEAGRLATDRGQRRIDAVGLPTFLRENTVDRLNPARSDSLSRMILRQANPTTLFPRALEHVTGLVVEEGQLRYGSDTPTEFSSRYPTFSENSFNFGGIPLAAPAPNDIAGGDQGFFGELAQRSPEFRNLMRSMQPAINEAGTVGFAPQHGQFGDFGSAGSLSGLLWLANLPGGSLTGLMYDGINLIRHVGTTPLHELLDSSPYTEGRPPYVLRPLFGSDLAINQQWSEERYLSTRGNPALSWLPSSSQTYLGFLADMAIGFTADSLIVDPIWNLATGAKRRIAQQSAQGLPGPRGGAPGGARGVQAPTGPVDLPNFSSAVDANRFADALDVRIARANQRMADNVDDLEFVGRMTASINVMERQRDAIRNLDFSSVSRVVQDSQTARASRGRAASTPDSIAFALTRRISEPSDLASLNVAIRSIDIARRGGTEVTDAVRALARFGVVSSSVAPSARILANQSLSFIPVTDVARPATQAAITMAETAPTMVPRSAVYHRLQGIQTQMDEIQRQLASTGVPERRMPLQQSVTNLIAEQKALTELMTAEEFSLYATDLITRADGTTVSVHPAGYLLENAPDEILDSILPTVHASFVSPRSSDTVPESIAALPVRDIDLSGNDFVRTRRDNESLSQLAQLWGLDGPLVTPVDATSELSNLYRMEALAKQYPHLLSRYGGPIPSFLVDTPGARVITRDAGILGEPAESALSDVHRRVPQPRVESTPQERRRARSVINQLSRRGERTSRRIAVLRDQLDADTTSESLRVNLEQQYDRLRGIQANVEEVYSRFPELAVADVIRALPDHLAPRGDFVSELAPGYVLAIRQFYAENSLVQIMRHELAVTDELLRSQGEQLLLQPPLERVDPINEFATMRPYLEEDGFDLHSVSEHDIPDSTLLTPEVRIPGDGMTGRQLVDHIVESTGATRDQASAAIFNGLQAGQFRRQGRVFVNGNNSMEELFRRADEVLPSSLSDPTNLIERREANRIARESVDPATNEAMGIPDLRNRQRPETAPPETPGEVIPMRPEGGEVLVPSRDENIIDLNLERLARQAEEMLGAEENALVQEVMERLQPLLDEMPEEVSGPLVQRASDILSQSTPEEAAPALMELLEEAMSGAEIEQVGQGGQGVDTETLLADDVDPMEAMFMEEPRDPMDDLIEETDFLFDEPDEIVLGYQDGRRVFGLRDSDGNILTGPGGERRIEPITLGETESRVTTSRVNEVESTNRVNEVVSSMPADLGDNKVFISSAYEQFADEMSLDEFKDMLVEMNRSREIDLGRADMAFALDQDKVRSSLIQHQNSEFHFIRKPVAPPEAPPASIRTVRDGHEFDVFLDVDNDRWVITPPGSDTDVMTALTLLEVQQKIDAFPLPDRLPTQTVYHGTHAQSLLPDTRVTSLSNELGMGLYVTTNPNEAVLYARASTSQDAIIQGTVRPKFTSEGRVFEIVMPADELTPAPQIIRRQESFADIYGLPNVLDGYSVGDGLNVVDAMTLGEGARGEGVGRVLQESFRDAMSDILPKEHYDTIWRRFQGWSKKHPYREWHQYLRSQIIKEVGPDSQAVQFRVFENIQSELSVRNVDAIRDGNTLNLVNDLGFYAERSLPDTAAMGSLAEQLAARAEIQKLAFSRNPTKTNEVAMQQAFHDLNTFQREQLAGALQQQETAAVEAVRELMRREDSILELNRAAQVDAEVRKQMDLEQRITREADTFDADTDNPCL